MGALDDLEGTISQILGKTGRMTAGGVASLADMARPVSDPVYTGLGYLARGTGFPHTADILFGAANAPTNAEIAQKYYDSITQGKYTPRNNFESIIDAIGQMGVGAMTPMGLAKGYSALDRSGILADESGSLGGINARKSSGDYAQQPLTIKEVNATSDIFRKFQIYRGDKQIGSFSGKNEGDTFKINYAWSHGNMSPMEWRDVAGSLQSKMPGLRYISGSRVANGRDRLKVRNTNMFIGEPKLESVGINE